MEALGMQIEPLRSRLAKVVVSTSNIGWGYHDTLSELFYEAFSE